jgi:hypothetical protein
MAGAWPSIKTAKALVDEGIIPCSEETLRGLAKRHTIGRILGRAYVFTPADVETLLEKLPCPSSSPDDTARPTGISEGPSESVALTRALALATRTPQKKSSHSGRRNSSRGQSTVIALHEHSQKRP